MTSIKANRAATWAEWNSMPEAARLDAGIATVYTPDRSERGFAATSESDCRCGGLGACNLRVIWSDGSLTHCCTRGMESSGDEDERMPGGFAEWVIR